MSRQAGHSNYSSLMSMLSVHASIALVYVKDGGRTVGVLGDISIEHMELECTVPRCRKGGVL